MIMLAYNGKYLKPSKDARVLAVLGALSDDSTLSQFELGRRLSLSGAMINQYLKRLQEDGHITFKPINGKSFRYELTKQGELTLRDMFLDYSVETIQFYSAVKGYIQARLRHLASEGKSRLVLFGASETCEVVLSALEDMDLTVLALCDNDRSKQGKSFHGHMICDPVMLEQMEPDAVVITSFGKQDEIHTQLEPLSKKRKFSIVRF